MTAAVLGVDSAAGVLARGFLTVFALLMALPTFGVAPRLGETLGVAGVAAFAFAPGFLAGAGVLFAGGGGGGFRTLLGAAPTRKGEKK